jgi:2-dehydro-3-deoxyphosphogluconate aldolase / (4S)-4-hydroxy-2-oxoglutarate aldolase
LFPRKNLPLSNEIRISNIEIRNKFEKRNKKRKAIYVFLLCIFSLFRISDLNIRISHGGAMKKEAQLRQVLESGIVAVVRSQDSQQLVDVVKALADGGVTVVEITMSVPNALDVLKQVRQALGDRVLLGAGTVLDPETARAVLLAGAEYIVSPTVNLDVIRLCRRYDKLVMPGAFTPTEILSAWEAGADIVKVFPAEVVGPAFFKALRGPLPQIRVMPTGGVDLTTAAAFLKAGACCLGIGSQLVEPEAVAKRDFGRIRDLAKQYAAIVKQFPGA